jgi:NAD(P)-dependent dehydrogenase (short-subunit alcohol dehydrogenase family)
VPARTKARTKPDRIHAAIEASGPTDALVNNTGIGVVGAFEATSMSHVRRVFETTTFGVTQAVIPQLRARRSGDRQRHLQRDARRDAAGYCRSVIVKGPTWASPRTSTARTRPHAPDQART